MALSYGGREWVSTVLVNRGRILTLPPRLSTTTGRVIMVIVSMRSVLIFRPILRRACGWQADTLQKSAVLTPTPRCHSPGASSHDLAFGKSRGGSARGTECTQIA